MITKISERLYYIQYSLFYAYWVTSDISFGWSLIFVVLFSELNTSNRRSDVCIVTTFRHIYGLGLDWGKNRTNCQFLKIRQDARTEAQKEEVSGQPGRMVGLWLDLLMVGLTLVKYDLWKFNFSRRMVNTWNSLPNWVVSANTTDTFKARLDKVWRNQDIVYNFRAKLHGTGSRIEVLCEEFQ